MDISESGRQIGEKLFVLLDAGQRKELTQFVIEEADRINSVTTPCLIPPKKEQKFVDQPLTELREGDIFFCMEYRLVSVRGQEIELTAKEFDIFSLFIMNPRRVFAYEIIMNLVWNEDYTYCSRKAINNHISNLRKKLKVAPDSPNYIKSIIGVGYKLDIT